VELDQLLLDNLIDFDDAAKRIGDLERAVGEAIQAAIAQWCKENDWTFTGEWLECDLELIPPGWREDSAKRAKARWAWDTGHGDSGEGVAEEDYFFLTRLLGAGSGHLRFVLVIETSTMKKKEWTTIAQKNSDTLIKLGMILDDAKLLYAPLKLNSKAVLEGLKDEALHEAMEPVTQLLSRLSAASNALEELIPNLRTVKRKRR
jgi:hypothetical protein